MSNYLTPVGEHLNIVSNMKGDVGLRSLVRLSAQLLGGLLGFAIGKIG
ncbi:MAG: hypothetical protein ACKOZL_05630 [Actinomycetes bacterium]